MSMDSQKASQSLPKAKNETTEVFNPTVDCWKAVTSFKDGYVVEEHYYDENGAELHEPYIAR